MEPLGSALGNLGKTPSLPHLFQSFHHVHSCHPAKDTME